MREFLKSLELDKDTIEAIMAEHGKKITSYVEQHNSLQEKLTEAGNTIKSLEKNKSDTTALHLGNSCG